MDALTRSAIVAAHAVGRGRDPAPDRLADDEHVGLEAPRAGRAGGAGADGVGLIDDEDRVGLPGQVADRVVIAGLGQDDADVRERGLDEHGGDVAVLERSGEAVDVVEVHDPGRLGDIDRCPDQALPRTNTTVRVEDRERLIDRAVVALVVDDDLAAAADVAGQADREAVRIRGRQRELPGRQAEPPLELLARTRWRPRSGACG